MQQTGFLPIPPSSSSPSSGFSRRPSFGEMGQAGGSRINDVTMSGLSQVMMRNDGSPPGLGAASPSSNPHSGFHPSSFGPLSFSALALGATQSGSSPYSSSIAMSISPPRWQPGSLGGGFGGSGSFVGSVGALGTSFGRQAEGRERELEAKYVRDFTCCNRQLSGLHELLEHYEEEHANLAPDVRMAAISAVQSNGFNTLSSLTPPAPKRSFSSGLSSMSHGEVPQPPGMMDIEMDDPMPSTPQAMLQQASVAALGVNLSSGGGPTVGASPWSAAFRATSLQPPACVPPSVLSYAPPVPTAPSTPTPVTATITIQTNGSITTSPGNGANSTAPNTPTQSRMQSPSLPVGQLTQEQIQAKLLKKAQKKAEREAKENETDDGPGEKRFRCPIEGCGKVYKQANGLKYHLTRSINSGHGNVAAMGGLMALLDGKDE